MPLEEEIIRSLKSYDACQSTDEQYLQLIRVLLVHSLISHILIHCLHFLWLRGLDRKSAKLLRIKMLFQMMRVQRRFLQLN